MMIDDFRLKIEKNILEMGMTGSSVSPPIVILQSSIFNYLAASVANLLSETMSGRAPSGD